MDQPHPSPIEPGEPPPGGELAFRRSWPSRADVREHILSEVANVLTSAGWVTGSDHAWLRLCLDEALTNALYHGNEGDPRLSVTVSVLVDADRWRVLMADEGTGFDASQLPRLDRCSDLVREHGRGIRLMQEWLDALRYWRGGRLVELERRRADRGPEGDLKPGTAPPPA